MSLCPTHFGSLLRCGLSLFTAGWLFGCSDVGGVDLARFNSPVTIEILRGLPENISKQEFYNHIYEGPLYVLLRIEVQRRAGQQGVTATSSGDEQWFYAADHEAFYIVEMEGESVLWVTGPIEGDVHAFINDNPTPRHDPG